MIEPIKLLGNWDEGYALDYHMLNSEFLGYDENGKERFKNTRTNVGELLYQIKYNHNKERLKELLNLMRSFLDEWNIKYMIDLLIAVPPSKQNRKYQPVFEIANLIGRYIDKPVDNAIFTKKDKLQAKDGYNIVGTIEKNRTFDKPVNILIVDDLYSTGTTLNEVAKVLKKDINVRKIYVLVMTKTRKE